MATYRGIKYTPVQETEEVCPDGKVLTYRGVPYARQDNHLERIRRIDQRKLRYRGAQNVMARA